MKISTKWIIIILMSTFLVLGSYILLQKEEKIDVVIAASGAGNTSDIQLMARAINRRS